MSVPLKHRGDNLRVKKILTREGFTLFKSIPIIKMIAWTKLLLASILGSPLYILSKLIPKSDNIWVFGSTDGKFIDNSKYLYLYTKVHYPHIHTIWISKDIATSTQLRKKGINAYYEFSLLGMLYSMRAKYVFVSSHIPNDVNPYTIGNSKIVQLWHGVPLKVIEWDRFPRVKETLMYKLVKFFDKKIFSLFSYDYLLVPSIRLIEIFKRAFDIPEDSRLIIAGYPRNQAFLTPRAFKDQDKDEHITRIEKKISEYSAAIFYLPTFREAYEFNPFSKKYKFDKLMELLKEQNILLLIKPHPRDTNLIRYLKKLKNQEDHVLVLSPYIDIYPLLTKCSILITDYSSIFFDFMLTRKPIIFAAFDLDEYLSKDRGTYFEYTQIVPGPVTKDWVEVREHVEKYILTKTKTYVPKIDRILIKTLQLDQVFCKNASSKIIKQVIRHELNPKSQSVKQRE